jgi:solute carrier family 25 protein 39/40
MIYEEEGLEALWRGNAARCLRVAPACAIMLGCYEMGKSVFLNIDNS